MTKAESSKNWYTNNREAILARRAKRRAERYEECSAQKKEYNATYYLANKEEIRTQQAAYYDEHRVEIKAYDVARYADRREEHLTYLADYRVTKKEEIRAQKATMKPVRNTQLRVRYKNDVGYRLAMLLRGRLRMAIRRGTKAAPTLVLLGCTVEALKTHLEAQFLPGMTWENHGYGDDKWNIDHVRPCASFDLTDPAQQRICFHFSNLQPLWQPDNLRKGSNQSFTWPA